MVNLTIGERSYTCKSNETVLDALLRQDVQVSFACKKGTCLSCILNCTDTVPPVVAQNGLKETMKKQNYFLACQCVPEQDMSIKIPEKTEFYTEGKVVVHDMLNRNTLLLIVECKDIIEYSAGQFVNLQRADGLTRSYSISNIPQESNTLEFHIRRLPGGRFSEWVHNELAVGDKLAVSEPQGHCYYLPENKHQAMLLVGTGTGLAPLAGILSDALAQGHAGPIHLFHGSSEIEDLYKIDDMRQLAKKYQNFYYTPCVSRGSPEENFSAGRVHNVALADIQNFQGWRVFLCGHPYMVSQMKREVFLKGAAMADIYTDAFEISTA